MRVTRGQQNRYANIRLDFSHASANSFGANLENSGRLITHYANNQATDNKLQGLIAAGRSDFASLMLVECRKEHTRLDPACP